MSPDSIHNLTVWLIPFSMSSSYPRDQQVDIRQDWGLIEAEQPPSYSEATAYPDSLSTAYPDSHSTAYPDSQSTAYPDSQSTAYPDSQATAYPDTSYTAYPSNTFPGVHQAAPMTFPQGLASREADRSHQDPDDNWEAESMAVREGVQPATRGFSGPCTRCVIVGVVLTVKLVIIIIVVVVTRSSHRYY